MIQTELNKKIDQLAKTRERVKTEKKDEKTLRRLMYVVFGIGFFLTIIIASGVGFVTYHIIKNPTAIATGAGNLAGQVVKGFNDTK